MHEAGLVEIISAVSACSCHPVHGVEACHLTHTHNMPTSLCLQAAATASCEAAAAAAAGAVGGLGSGAADMLGSGDLGGSLMSSSVASEVAPERGASMALDGVAGTEGAEMEAEVGS